MAAGREHPQRDMDCSIVENKCKFKCCQPCSFCNRASTKERNKSWLVSCKFKRLYIKTCQRCFFCHSIALCPICDKCPSCCKKSACRGQTSNFWQTWLERGAGPKIVQILREGYTLPFRIRPNLTRSPTVISRYVNPHRNSYLLEALHQLMDKNAIELVHNQTSLGFFN